MEMGTGSFQTQLHRLYQEHHGWLCSLLRHRLGNTCDAADLAQDIYLQLIRKAHIPSAKECRRHLMQIAKGKLIDLYRRRALEARYLELQTHQPNPQAPSEELRAIQREALGAVESALQRQPSKIRQALLLSRLGGLGHQDIASQLQVSISSVEKYIAQGVQSCHRSQRGNDA